MDASRFSALAARRNREKREVIFHKGAKQIGVESPDFSLV